MNRVEALGRRHNARVPLRSPAQASEAGVTAAAGADALVPTLTFDSDDYPGGQALALWSGSVAYNVKLAHGLAPEQYRARMQAWRVDNFLVTAGFTSAMHTIRTPERIRSDTIDSICLMLVLNGTWHGDFDGLEVEVERGCIGFLDFGRPFTIFSPDCRFIMLSVPRLTLELSEKGAADRHGQVLDSLSGRLLADHFGALALRLPETPSRDLPTVAAATLAMIRTCLAQTPHRDERHAALSLRQRARAYVNAHLTDTDLTPNRIAEALFITRSTLYRAFSTAGVASFIQGQRLEAIHAMLENAAETRNLVELAVAFGFASHAHLTNAFRRRFGYPPSQARRGAQLVAEPSAESVHTFQAWLSALGASANIACPPGRARSD